MHNTLITRSLMTIAALTALSFPLSAQTKIAVVNVAGYQSNFPVAPGSLAAAFAYDGTFTGSPSVGATATPLPTMLGGGQLAGGTQVLVDGAAVPLLYVSPGQINFQVPSGLSLGQHSVTVKVGNAQVASGVLNTIKSAPGVFSVKPGDILQPGAVLNADYTLNASNNPAPRGGAVIVYGTGQGPLDNPIQDGNVAVASPLSNATAETEGWVAATKSEVLFSGMAPGFVGLWQVNLYIPNEEYISGPTALFLKSDGIASNAVTIWVAE